MDIQFNCPLSINDLSKNHCALCEHHVVDCRTKTDAEIHLLANTSKKFCGIFKSNQIKNANQSVNQTLFKIAFVFVFVLGFNETKAASFIQPDTTQLYQKAENNTTADTIATSPVLQGIIRDDSGEAMPFAKVMVETSTGVFFYALTDFDGAYSIALKYIPVGTLVSVTARYIGYQTQAIVNVKLGLSNTVNITLKEPEQLIVGIIINVEPRLIPYDPYDFGKQNVVIRERR